MGDSVPAGTSSDGPVGSSLNITSTTQVVGKDELKIKGQRVSECMLGNYLFTMAGLTYGTVQGIRRKNLRPFVVGISFGTIGDMMYAYWGNCREVIDDYNRAKSSFDAVKHSGNSKGPG